MTSIEYRSTIHIITSALALTLVACNGQLAVLDSAVGGSAITAGASGASMQQGGGDQGGNGSEQGGSGGSGGSEAPNTCEDLVRNGDEIGVDCGGECPACPPSCDDAVQNGDEEGVDCGGSCLASNQYCQVQLEDCDCAATPGLMPIACGGRADVRAFFSADADSAAFDLTGKGIVNTFRWTLQAGAEPLPGGGVVGMSADGTRVLMGGRSLWRSDGTTSEAPGRTAIALSEDGETILEHVIFAEGYLTRSDGETELWPATYGQPISVRYPNAMSPDGSVVVGFHNLVDNGVRTIDALRWTSAGLVALEPRSDGISGAEAMAVNRDGTVIAGFTFDTNDGDARVGIFRWTSETGMVVVAPGVGGYLLQDFSPIYRLWLSDDGNAVIGTSGAGENRTVHRAFRWTEATGTVLLDATLETVVRAIDAAGNTIAGYVLNGAGVGAPFLWTEGAGFQLLADVFAARSVDTNGWELREPLAVSADGRFVLGAGSCGGVPSVYRATIAD